MSTEPPTETDAFERTCEELVERILAGEVGAHELLGAVIDNVVGNAIEQNDRQPELHVSIRKPDRSGDRVEISVADNRPGIPDGTVRGQSHQDVSDPYDVLDDAGLGL